jgi:hypothetical protein
MKRCLLSLLLLALVVPICASKSTTTENTSRSYLSVPSNYHSASPEFESGFRADRTHVREDGWHGAFEAIVFGGRSTHSDLTARYFFPFGKTTLLVSNDMLQSVDQLTKTPADINAVAFGIDGVNLDPQVPFISMISIAPRQTVVGGGFHWRQSLWRSEEKGRGFWFDFSFPVENIKNEMNLTENITSPVTINTAPGTAGYIVANNMIAAFQQTGWNYGKIDDSASAMKRTGVADIEIKFGYEWLDQKPCHVESYIGVIAPTGNKPTATYVFEAIVGNGGHVGVEWGSNVGIELWSNDCGDRSLRAEMACNSKYLFKKEQLRSLDLKYKPWSRYIQLYANQAAAVAAATAGNIYSFTPGINILTQEVEVTPGFINDMNCAWLFQAKGFRAELGYNLYARRSETIELDAFNSTAAIKQNGAAGLLNPVGDITPNAFLYFTTGDILAQPFPIPVTLGTVNLYSVAQLTLDDLDLVSASTPAALIHTIYGSLGYDWDDCEWPVGVHIGSSYTFANSNNSVMDHWLVWGKLGISI